MVTEQETRWYKVLGTSGEPIHGGSGTWSLPVDGNLGDWMPTIDSVRCCKSGYHLVEAHALPEWLAADCTIYLAEGRGASHTDGDGKTAFAQARLVRRLELSDRDLRLFAADCAEHVLHLFEAEHPNDDRPRKAIEATRAYARGEITAAASGAARAAAWDAAWGAARAAAGAAARDAAWGAARDAAWAAAGAAAWDAARAAAGGAAWAAAGGAAWDAAGGAAWDAAGDAAWDAAWAAERAWQGEKIMSYLTEEP